MFIKAQVEPKLNQAIIQASELERAHLYLIQQMLEKPTRIVAGAKPLNRYSIQPGKTFAASTKSKEKFKVLRVLADDIVLQDLSSRKVYTVQVDRLLKEWSAQGIQEISLLEDIVQTVQNVLGPVLGIFLTTALIKWLSDMLR